MFYHIGHNVDRLLWMISPTHEWLEDKLADLYQWAMRKSTEYDDYYEVWKKALDNVMTKGTVCPHCEGTGKDGHDRCNPPSWYICDNCNGSGRKSKSTAKTIKQIKEQGAEV